MGEYQEAATQDKPNSISVPGAAADGNEEEASKTAEWNQCGLIKEFQRTLSLKKKKKNCTDSDNNSHVQSEACSPGGVSTAGSVSSDRLLDQKSSTQNKHTHTHTCPWSWG